MKSYKELETERVINNHVSLVKSMLINLELQKDNKDKLKSLKQDILESCDNSLESQYLFSQDVKEQLKKERAMLREEYLYSRARVEKCIKEAEKKIMLEIKTDLNIKEDDFFTML